MNVTSVCISVSRVTEQVCFKARSVLGPTHLRALFRPEEEKTLERVAFERSNLLQFLCFELLGTVVKQFLVHLHEEFQRVVDQAVYCPVSRPWWSGSEPSNFLPTSLPSSATALCPLTLQLLQRPCHTPLGSLTKAPSLFQAARGALRTGPGAPRFLSWLTAATFRGNGIKNTDT